MADVETKDKLVKLSVLKSVNDDLKNQQSDVDGIINDGVITLARGRFENKVYNPATEKITSLLYRISSRKPIIFPMDVTLIIADGFRIYYYYYDNDDGWKTDGKWKTGSFDIPASEHGFYCQIARVTEDTSETADINEFLSAVKIETSVSKLITDTMKHSENYNMIIPEQIHRNYTSYIFEQSGTVYTPQSICSDGSKFYISARDESGTGNCLIVVVNSMQDLTNNNKYTCVCGHANDLTYYNGNLYICTANSNGSQQGEAPINSIGVFNTTTNVIDRYITLDSSLNIIGVEYYKDDKFILFSSHNLYITDATFETLTPINNGYDIKNIIIKSIDWYNTSSTTDNIVVSQIVFVDGDNAICVFAVHNNQIGYNNTSMYSAGILCKINILTGEIYNITTFPVNNYYDELESVCNVNGIYYLLFGGKRYYAISVAYSSNGELATQTHIKTNTNLNDFKRIGTFHCSYGKRTNTIQNLPISVTSDQTDEQYGFTLVNSTQGGVCIRQTVTPTWNSDTYSRVYNPTTSTWSSWVKSNVIFFDTQNVAELPSASAENYLCMRVITTDGTDALYMCLKKDSEYYWRKIGVSSSLSELVLGESALGGE